MPSLSLSHQLSLLGLLHLPRPLQLRHVVIPVRVADPPLTRHAVVQEGRRGQHAVQAVVVQPVPAAGPHVPHVLSSALLLGALGGGLEGGGCGQEHGVAGLAGSSGHPENHTYTHYIIMHYIASHHRHDI